MVVLMAFNKKDQWTFEELVAETGKLISVHLMIISLSQVPINLIIIFLKFNKIILLINLS